jgi:multiple sugar transport system permease protein
MQLRQGVRRQRSLEQQASVRGLWLIAPSLVLVMIIVFYPLVRGIVASFKFSSLTRPDYSPFIGLDNYREFLGSAEFWPLLRNSIVWTVGTVALQFTLGLGIALLLNEPIRCRGLLRGIIVIPWVVPSVLVALMWKWMFHAQAGLINSYLIKWGLINEYVPWLGQSKTALASVMVAAVWQGTPFFVVTLLAGLQSIPVELYEAAAVDGASGWSRFTRITMPMLKPTATVSTTLAFIWRFNWIDLLYNMTKGGPGISSHTLATYGYIMSFTYGRLGYAAAIGVVMLILIFGFAVLYLKQVAGAQEGTI